MFLYKGLPTFEHDGKYITFSPFCKSFIIFPSNAAHSSKIDEIFDDKRLYEPKRDIEDVKLLTLVLTNKCNLSCQYCYENTNTFNNKELKIIEAIAGLKFVSNSKAKRVRILFHGGEPTLCFQLIRDVHQYAINRLKDKFFDFHIITNGVFNCNIATQLIDMGFEITISIDGRREIHDFHRPLSNGGSSFDIVVSNIASFVKMKVPLQILTIITNETVKEIPKIVEFLGNLGVKLIRFEPLIKYGRAKSCVLSPPDGKLFADWFIKGMEVAKKFKVQLTNSAIVNLLSPANSYCKCSRGGNLAIAPDGLVVLCHEINAADKNEKDLRIAGKLNKRTLQFEIDINKLMEYENLTCTSLNENCRNCFAVHVCGGGCPTRNMTYTGKLGTLDNNLCELRRELLKNVLLYLLLKR